MQLWLCLRTIVHCNLRSKTILLVLLLLRIHVNCIAAERTCHQCRGINCQRTSYEATKKCTNNLDICVTVFDGQTIQAQGCLEELSDDLRNKCSIAQQNEQLSECYKCNTNLCNSLASSSFECIQCDSNTDVNCRSNPSSLKPSRCQIARSPNEYCYVKQDGNHVIRGCSLTVKEQRSCLSAEGCLICQPSELSGCNSIDVDTDNSAGSGGSEGSESGSGGGGSEGSESGSGSGGSETGSGTGGSGNGGSEGSGSGSGSGGSQGSGSGSGDGESGGGSGGNDTSTLNFNIFTLIVNVFIILLWK